MIKKSVSIAGHRTSVALEIEFWNSLDEILIQTKTSLGDFFIQIDKNRTTGLASAVRVYILNYYKQQTLLGTQ
jgi:predicted DNA-binding ribbon-helix-helix protein